MELADFSKPGEKKKLIWAGVLGLVAILFLWWTFVGFGSGSTSPSSTRTPTNSPTPTQPVGARPQRTTVGTAVPQVVNISDLQSLQLQRISGPAPIVPEPRRNIFAYYEK